MRSIVVFAEHANHGGVTLARTDHGAIANDVIVLTPDPGAAPDVRRADELQELVTEIVGCVSRHRDQRCLLGPRLLGAIVLRRGVGQQIDRQVHDDDWVGGAGPVERVVSRGRLADESTGVGDAADNRRVEVPLRTDVENLLLAAFLGNHQHAFLRFTEKHLVRSQRFGTSGNCIEVELDTVTRTVCHLDGGRSQAGGAHVLYARQAIGCEDLEACLEKKLFHERVTDLYGGKLTVRFFAELRACHRRPVNAIATCLCADVEDRVANAFRDAEEEVVGLGYSHGESVDQDVPVVARVELNFPTDRRDSDAVSITADARDHTLEQMWCFRMLGSAEPQRVQGSDGTRTHGEDITQNAPDTGRRALIRLDIRRVIVGFHFEDGAKAVADVDRSSVFSRTLHHLRSSRR